MNVKKLLIAGIAVYIVEFVTGWLTCGWLFNWVYQIPPNIWKSSMEITQTTNVIGINIMGIIKAMLFALVFALIYKGIPYQGVKRGMLYGLLVWLVGALPGIASMPFYMTIANAVVIYWLIQSFILSIITGGLVGSIYKND